MHMRSDTRECAPRGLTLPYTEPTKLTAFLPWLGGYWVAALSAAFYGVTLAGFTPLSVLMSLMAPGQEASAIAVLNLGAGAATFVGPLIVAIFLSLTGPGG